MSRLATLKELLAKDGYGAAALVPGPNLFYLTGLSMGTSERVTMAVVPVQGEPFIICPMLEAE
ncbi:MAG: aminopeptidase P family N-terminal domain-containing protein, partial [Symbiobacteriaceae bacterium]|nr:aminopeptidase P family N-terminal domain-containing protein [Symbiobacteriaceae bacterium]